jgi:multidrug transporter EmrE-like cation transporter
MLFALGLALGGINVLFFTKALKEISLSIAYPVFSGACIFFMVILSHLIFGEKLSLINMVGALVIVMGIALMSN